VLAVACTGCKTSSQGTPGSTTYEETGRVEMETAEPARSQEEQERIDMMGNRMSDNIPNPGSTWRNRR
jgi:hypothetical protein